MARHKGSSAMVWLVLSSASILVTGCMRVGPAIHIDPNPQSATMVRVEMWDAVGFNRPLGIATDAFGRILVSDTGNHRVLILDEHGQSVGSFGRFGQGPGELDRPAGLAVDTEGCIYVADSGNRRVQKYDSAGTFLLATERNPYFPLFSDVAVGEAGQIYAVSSGQLAGGKAQIYVFTPDGRLASRLGSNVTGYVAAQGDQIYVNNTFYSGRNQSHYLECYSRSELLWRRLYDFDSVKGDILIDPADGDLIVIHTGLARIVRCDDDGDPVETLVEEDRTKPDFPMFVAAVFLSPGRLAVLDADGGAVFIYECTQ